MGTLVIEWLEKPAELARDSAFYRDYGHDQIAAVIIDGRHYANVYCDGEMRLNPTEKNPDQTVIRDCRGLTDAGIETDTQLYDAVEKNLWVWDNNPWFDFYAPDGTHLDLVCDDIDHVIATAEALANGDEDLDGEQEDF